MANRRRYDVIGLDLGGTNSVFGIVNSEGSVVTSTSIRTKGLDGVVAVAAGVGVLIG